jgi:hypothetical protein
MKFGGRTVQNVVLLFLAISLTLTGVVASVAITVRGNSSQEDNVISLGVGKAQATSCNSDTQAMVNTVSDWDDTVTGVGGAAPGDFVLTRVNVTGVQSSCATNVMTLVIAFKSPVSDLTVTCTLPSATNSVYPSGTFVFPTNAEYEAGTGEYVCTSFATGLPMSEIEAAAIEIK